MGSSLTAHASSRWSRVDLAEQSPQFPPSCCPSQSCVAGGGVTASAYGSAAVAAVVTRSVDTVIVMATVTGAAGTAIFEDMAATSDDMGVTSVGTAGGGNPLRS